MDTEGVYLTFSDGKTFLYPQTFLFSTRFTYAHMVREITDPSRLARHANQPGQAPDPAQIRPSAKNQS